MWWVAEWFDLEKKLVIEADSLNEADDRAYQLVSEYPDSIYLGSNDE